MKEMYLTDRMDERVKVFYDYCIEAIKTKEGKKIVDKIKDSGIFFSDDGFVSCNELMDLMKNSPEKIPDMLATIEMWYEIDLEDTGGYYSLLTRETNMYLSARLAMYEAELLMKEAISGLKDLEQEDLELALENGSDCVPRYINPELKY